MAGIAAIDMRFDAIRFYRVPCAARASIS